MRVAVTQSAPLGQSPRNPASGPRQFQGHSPQHRRAQAVGVACGGGWRPGKGLRDSEVGWRPVESQPVTTCSRASPRALFCNGFSCPVLAFRAPAQVGGSWHTCWPQAALPPPQAEEMPTMHCAARSQGELSPHLLPQGDPATSLLA